MLRPAFAAMLGAAFACLAFPGVRARMIVPEQWADLAALGWTVGFAGLAAILLMACREVRRPAPDMLNPAQAETLAREIRAALLPERDDKGKFKGKFKGKA